MNARYGKNTRQVESLLDRLTALPPDDWKMLQDAHAGAPTLDAAEDALAMALAKKGLRQSWFDLRALATVITKRAAVDYAARTGEAARTIEHVAAVNAWDGQHEASKLEVLGPAHERGFHEAACGALGVVLSRPYIAEGDFERFWAPYEPVLGPADAT